MYIYLNKKKDIKIHLNINAKKHMLVTKLIMLGLSVLLVVLIGILIVFGGFGVGDNKGPEIEIKDHSDYVVAYLGEGVVYSSQLDITDNITSKKNIEIIVDDSNVNLEKAGMYTAKVTAIDKNGNKTTKSIQVRVYAERATWEKLEAEIKPIADEIFSEGMSKENKCRAIYKYIHSKISYYDYSDKSDWMQAAYYGLRDGKGDCFTYYSVAKGLLKYAGIDNKMIQRKEGKTSGTHYWSVVNIGTENDPVWYHFDCTPLNPNPYGIGCLMTSAQLEDYNEYRGDERKNKEDYYFYYYGKSGLPKISTEEITTVQY